LGLQILEREKQIYMAHPEVQPDLEGQSYVIGRQLKPEARRDMIAQFAAHKIRPTAMIDLSDGLASDLMHICKASGTGARIDEATIPMHDEAEAMALKFKLDPVTCALHGGEDYELLFTADIADLETLRIMEGIYIIGEVRPMEEGLHLQTAEGTLTPLKAQGWVHFEGDGE
jgi:thiamine-monophosphate kinase